MIWKFSISLDPSLRRRETPVFLPQNTHIFIDYFSGVEDEGWRINFIFVPAGRS
jgi:hypothetical protein